jgi:ubiquinone/menaquinone biosynthesis C-methylase UbiE
MGVIRRNRERHPSARWEVGSGYHIPVADGAAGACFGFYVLEHAVYPERMLAEMLRVTAPRVLARLLRIYTLRCLAYPS